MKTDHILSFKCPIKWNNLEDREDGKLCHHCKKIVYDLRDCSLTEISEIRRKKGPICAAVSVAAVSLALGLSSCGEEENNKPDSTSNQPENIIHHDDCLIIGEIAPEVILSPSNGNIEAHPQSPKDKT